MMQFEGIGTASVVDTFFRKFLSSAALFVFHRDISAFASAIRVIRIAHSLNRKFTHTNRGPIPGGEILSTLVPGSGSLSTVWFSEVWVMG